MKTLVLGGTGFVGARIVEELRSVGVPVAAGSRSPKSSADVRIDLNDPSTFGGLGDFGVVVNCTAPLAAPPDAAIGFCRERGAIFLETTAHFETVGRLLGLRGESALPGPLVLGVGLFPGLSNLTGAALLRALGEAAASLDVAIRFSPFSGAGDAMCEQMTDLLFRPWTQIEAGAVRDLPPFEDGPILDFSTGRQRTVGVSLPEVLLLHASTRVPRCRTLISFRPVALRRVVRALARCSPPLISTETYRWLLNQQVTVARSLILRRVATEVEIRCEAATGSGERWALTTLVDDGIQATATAIAATALLARSKGQRIPAGVHTAEELFSLEETVDLMRQVRPSGGISIAGPEGVAAASAPAAAGR